MKPEGLPPQGMTRRDFLITAVRTATVAAGCAGLSLLADHRASAAQMPLPTERMIKSEVSEEWKRALGMGTNVANWFRFQPGNPEHDKLAQNLNHLKNYINKEDLELMGQMGITSVRLPVSTEWLYEGKDDIRMNHVSAAIEKFKSAGIKTIVSMHESDPFKIEKSDYAKQYINYWGGLVKKLASEHTDDFLAFESFNEPVFDNGKKWLWNDVQRRLLSETRKHAPDHIFIAKPASWSTKESLNDLTLLDDPKIVYSIHDYSPYLLTHQNQSWANKIVKGITRLEFSANPEQEKGKSGIEKQYYDQKWTPDKVKKELSIASEWAKKNGVPLIIGEYGAYPEHMKPGTQITWMKAILEAVKESGGGILGVIPWAWDEQSGFGVIKDSLTGRIVGINEEVKQMFVDHRGYLDTINKQSFQETTTTGSIFQRQ